MYHVFICYPRTFIAHVSPLHDALELALRNIYRRDAQVFQDTSDLQALNQWEGDVNTALEHARVMIVVVVPTILESPQCRREMLHFIDTPGKHIVPLTCEAVPRLRQLAESLDDHPEGSAEHEIAICAQALRTWQEFDFSEVIYQSPDETAYKVAIAKLARMIRNKLDQEDHAASDVGGPVVDSAKTTGTTVAGTDATATPTESTVERDAGVTGGGAVDTGGRTDRGAGRSRRGLLVAGLVVVLAMAGIALWIGQTPAEEETLDRARAQALLARVMTDAVSQADHVSFDAETGALRIAAPPVGSVATRIALQPGIDPLLQAGFVPGFAEASADGDACFALDGDPLMLEGEDLGDGEFVTMRLRLYERADPQGQKVCLTAGSTWRPIEASNAVVGSGAILAAPRDDAREYRTLRRGQQVPGPFWTNNEVPGWVRMEYRDGFAYLRRDVILELR